MPKIIEVVSDPLEILKRELSDCVPFTDKELHFLRVSMEENTVERRGSGVCGPGDVWTLGRHKLMCGSSTSRADVLSLMGTDRAMLVVTDPPYGVSFVRGQFISDPKRKSSGLDARNGATWKENREIRKQESGSLRSSTGLPIGIIGDERKAQDQADFIKEVFELTRSVCRAGTSIYMFSASMTEGVYSMLGLADSGVHLQSQLIWVKNSMVMGQADYQWRHEIIWYGWYEGAPHRWFGGRTLTTVLDCRKLSATYHPNEKPVELVEGMIANSSLPGEICYEPFSGSGTMIVACEKTNRVCRAMELDPHFCDVAIERWMAYTGQMAVREDGVRYSELKETT